MAGLRQRQKESRDRRIVEAAAGLFRKRGYDGVKMEAIAKRAAVSIGTIYNYYHNKGDLLVAIVAMEVDEVLKGGAKLVARPPADAGQAIDRLFAIYLEHSLVYLSKEMWRNAMAISTRQPDSPSGRIYSDLDRKLADQVRALICKLQERDSVRADIDAQAVGEMLFNNMNMMFTVFVKSQTMPLSRLRQTVSRQNRPLLAAIAVADEPRHGMRR